MAKIVQILTRPSQEYDYTVAEAQTRDIDGIIVKLNTTYQPVSYTHLTLPTNREV